MFFKENFLVRISAARCWFDVIPEEGNPIPLELTLERIVVEPCNRGPWILRGSLEGREPSFGSTRGSQCQECSKRDHESPLPNPLYRFISLIRVPTRPDHVSAFRRSSRRCPDQDLATVSSGPTYTWVNACGILAETSPIQHLSSRAARTSLLKRELTLIDESAVPIGVSF